MEPRSGRPSQPPEPVPQARCGGLCLIARRPTTPSSHFRPLTVRRRSGGRLASRSERPLFAALRPYRDRPGRRALGRDCVKTSARFHTSLFRSLLRGLRAFRVEKIEKNLALLDRLQNFAEFLHGLSGFRSFLVCFRTARFRPKQRSLRGQWASFDRQSSSRGLNGLRYEVLAWSPSGEGLFDSVRERVTVDAYLPCSLARYTRITTNAT